MDAVLRALGFSHGVNDVVLCHNGDYLLMHEWFEINRSLVAQARLEVRDVRRARRAWESGEVFEQLRHMRLALSRGELRPSRAQDTPMEQDTMHAAHARWLIACFEAIDPCFRPPRTSQGLHLLYYSRLPSAPGIPVYDTELGADRTGIHK